MIEGAGDRPEFNHKLNLIQKYQTSWINRSDWTNVHMGSSTVKNADSNVAHNFNSNLSDLIVTVFISAVTPTPTEAELNAASFSIELVNYTSSGSDIGFGATIYQVDSNNVKVQTGKNGLAYYNDVGVAVAVDTEDWYYKIVVRRVL